jgi:SAM-dependent methyltransferase
MQSYSENTARAYDRIWNGYGASFGRSVVEHWGYSGGPAAVLDLGCGTGSLASVLLDQGFCVTAIDASPHMLALARANCDGYVAAGSAIFLQADIRDFHLDHRVNFAVSCYDTINHLESLTDLRRCFACVMDTLLPGGTFIFDLNTIRGLDDWNRVKITDREDHAVISRGFFDRAQGRAWKKFSGFYEVDEGLYERFEEVIFNTPFLLEDVVGELQRAGFEEVGIRSLREPSRRLSEPEAEDRVLFVGSRPAVGP